MSIDGARATLLGTRANADRSGGGPDAPATDWWMCVAVLAGDLVAHTWGTETVLEIAGLPAGERYAVVLVARDGDVYQSGTFLGSEVTIDCRMNAALLRPDVADVEIRDDEGVVVGVAHAPAVG